jgi:phospholipid/cholesterol/gamma-HCH transport system substrate-binding protein
MENNPRYLIVGSVFLLLMIAIMFSILWYFEGNEDAQQRKFLIYFEKQSVSGLQVGSAITMRGIRIGEVKHISILSHSLEGARILIKIEDTAPVSELTRAVIERNLLTGLATIELTTIKPEEVTQSSILPHSQARHKHEKLPFILEGEGEVQKIKVSLSEAVVNLNSTLITIQSYLSDENRKKFDSSITNIENITHALADESTSLSSAIAHLQRLIENSQHLVRTMSDTSQIVARETQELSSSLRYTSNTIVNTVKEYKNPAKLIRGPTKDELGPGEK